MEPGERLPSAPARALEPPLLAVLGLIELIGSRPPAQRQFGQPPVAPAASRLKPLCFARQLSRMRPGWHAGDHRRDCAAGKTPPPPDPQSTRLNSSHLG